MERSCTARLAGQTFESSPEGFRPIEEAISCAGGIKQNALTARLQLKSKPHVFCCGEMLDWDAPTGGYLLTACFATGRLLVKACIPI